MVKFARNVGKKFNEDGTARKFQGNTIICHVPKDSPQFKFLVEYQKKLKDQPWAHKFSFLPSTSFHMTVFEGICDQVRSENRWIKSLPLDASLKETDKFLIDNLPKVEISERFNVRAKRINIFGVITLRLQPFDEGMEIKMRQYRDKLSEVFGIRALGHERYGFHISFAYAIEKTTFLEKLRIAKFMKKESKHIPKDFGTLKLNPPELTFFEDMTNFAHSRK